MRLRIPAVLSLLTLASLPAGGVAASGSAVGWDRFQDIPGASEVQRAMASGRRLVRGGRTGQVLWDGEDNRVWLRADGAWTVVDLAAGTEVDAEGLQRPPGDREEARPRGRRGGMAGRPARGRQATRMTSDDGVWTAIHRDYNVILENKDGSEIVVTTDGNARERFGTASWVYGEELDQQTAMWFSPDSTKLSYYAFDVTDVPDYYLLNGLTKLRTGVMDEAYPKPGDSNPIANLRIHDIESGRDVAVDVGDDDDQYIYGVQFSPDSKHLLFRRMNRHQNVLEIVVADPDTGASRVLIREEQPTWVAHDSELRWLSDGRRFLWSSERSGFKTFELWDVEAPEGRLATLGDGSFPTSRIVRVDEDDTAPGGGTLYFSGYGDEHPMNLQLYSVNFDGSDLTRMTGDSLNHSGFDIAPDGSGVVATGQTWDTAPEIILYGNDGARLRTLAKADLSRLEDSTRRASELFSFPTADGTQTCYGRIHYPDDFDPSRKWPVLVNVYGGPESSALRNNFEISDAMTQFGLVIVQIDNRGTEGRGKAFEGATYLKLGQVDLDDQADGIKALLSRHDFLDGDRVGITGHSYGGYMSALAVLRHPDVFNVAVAGAPVTDWRNYDTIYTERYMRTPAENEEGYDLGSCVELADQLEGELLILHGMVDDNVHPSNAWQLVDALQSRNIPFEMQFFPNAAHGIYSPASRSAKWSFLVEHLVGSD